MSHPIETVRIVAPVSDDNPNGFIVINHSDLTDSDVLFDEAAPRKGKKAAKADASAE